MKDRMKKLERQAKRADKLDDKARDIYRTAILIVSILIAAATVTVDFGALLSSYIFETGFLIDKDGLTIGSEFNQIVFVILYILGLFFTILLAGLLVMSLLLFTSVPYYAIRAQNSSKVYDSGQMVAAVLSDGKKIYRVMNPLQSYAEAKENKTGIICHEVFDPNIHGNIETVIQHNQMCLKNKHKNLEMAKSNIELSMASILMIAFSSAYIFYVV